MMWTLFVGIVASHQVDHSSTPIFFCDNTPFGLLSEFSSFSTQIKLSVEISPFEIILSPSSRFVDLTLNIGLLPLLDIIAENCQGVYVTLSPQEPGFYSKRRIYALNTETSEQQAITKMVKYLSFSEFFLLSSSNVESIKLAKLINEENKQKVFQFIIYGEDITPNVGLSLVQKMIKSTGISQILIVGKGIDLEVIQHSLIQKKINDAGAVFLFASSATGSIFLEGSLTICEQGTENSTSHYNYYYNSILSKLSQFDPTSSNLQVPYSILNIQSSSPITVGSISPNISISHPILYPGNIYSPSELNKKQVTLLISNGTNEIFNFYSSETFSHYYKGAIYAVNQTNELNEIARFHFNLRQADTGLYQYEENWYKQKLSEVFVSPYPIAMLTNVWSTAAVGTSTALKAMNIRIPQISPFSVSKEAEDKEKFPDLLKLSVSQTEIMLNFIDFIMSFGWKSVSIITTDDIAYYPYYLSIIELAKERGLAIVNPEDKRVLPFNYTRNDFEKYQNYFTAVKKTKCRIIIVLSILSGLIWEGLYDVGLRKGEVVVITDLGFTNYMTEAEEKYLVKTREITEGMFVFAFKEWNGELGESLKKVFSEMYSNINLLCLCYDSFFVVKQAVKYMLSIGEDYENPERLLYFMRENKVTGCMGTIYFSKDSTSLSNGKYLMMQVTFSSNGTMNMPETAYLDRLSTQFIYFVQAPKWPTDSVPTNFLPNFDCPFESKEIISSTKGEWVLIGLCTVFFIVTCIFSFLSYLKFKSSFKELTERQIMSFSDRAFYIYFLFQFMQILAMGPDQEAIKRISIRIGLILSFDFDQFYNLDQNEFWILFYSIFGFSVFWVFISLVMVFEVDIKYQDSWVCQQFSVFGNLIFPLIGSILFLPIFSMLMNLFLCSESVGDSLTDTFMDRDCYVYCYKGKHKALTAVTIVLIFFHLALGIYSKPLWELTQDSLSIRTKPSYLSALSVFQVILVILNKTLKFQSQFVHGCVCTILVFIFLLYTIVAKPYNHKPAFALQIASLVMSFWGLLISTMFRKFGSFASLIITQFSGFTLIAIVFFILFIRAPSHLYSTKGINIAALFIFQFCENYQKYTIDIESLDFSVSTKYRTENIQIMESVSNNNN